MTRPGTLTDTLSVESFLHSLFALASVLPHFADLADAVNNMSALRGQIELQPRVNVRNSLGTVAPFPKLSTRQEDRICLPQPKFELRDVTFAYPSRPTLKTLERLTLQIEAGKTTALVGPSGSGKSTVFTLLSREYDPVPYGVARSTGGATLGDPHPGSMPEQTMKSLIFSQQNTGERPKFRHMFSSQSSLDDLEKGSVVSEDDGGIVKNTGMVFFNEIDIRQYNLSFYRQQISVVSQQAQLFSMSIFGNVAAGLSGTEFEYDYSHDREDDADADVRHRARLAGRLVREALELVEAWDFVSALPHGMYTVVSADGSRSLSGGQRQRIALARALVRKPAVLLLDEATSALDAVTEEKIRVMLEREQRIRGMTLIIIAHRMSTIVDADRIVVMKDGGIVDDGTYQELMAEGRADRTFRNMICPSDVQVYAHVERPSSVSLDYGSAADDCSSVSITRSPSDVSSEGSTKCLLPTSNASEQDVYGATRQIPAVQTATLPSSTIEVMQCRDLRSTNESSAPRSAELEQVDASKSDKAINMGRLMGYWQAISGRKLWFSVGLLGAIAAGTGWPIESWLVGEAVHSLSSSANPVVTATRVNVWALWFLVLAIGILCCLMMNGIAFELVSERMVHNLRSTAMRALLRQETGFFETGGEADASALTSTLLVESSGVSGAAGLVLSQIIMALVNLLGAMLLGAILSWKITLVSVRGELRRHDADLPHNATYS